MARPATPKLPVNKTLISEVLQRVSNAKVKDQKVAILLEYSTPALKKILLCNFAKSIEFVFPPGKTPFRPLDRPKGIEHTMLISEHRMIDKFIKKATKINPDLLKGYPMDAFAEGSRSNVTKFPIRSNFLRAVTEGKDGMYLDSATKRLGKEGGSEYEILQTTYKQAEGEIAKIIRELGEDPKKYVKKFDDVDGDLDGTYVKIDQQIRDLVKDKGVDAFKDGGPAISKREQEKLAIAKKEEIKQQFDDVVKKKFI